MKMLKRDKCQQRSKTNTNDDIKGKDKVHPITGHEGPEGR
jgi:hypothetical protein